MSARTGISWTDSTFNPFTGCQRVSPGCDHCYAEKQAARFPAVFGQWGAHAERVRTSAANWKQPLAWDRAAAKAGVPRRVFCGSMCDVFDNAVPPEWRRDLFAMIRDTPHLRWQLLTKRPQNVAGMLPADWGDGYANVMLGTTAENQAEADRRLPLLRAIPARVRFVSAEPLLEPVTLDLRGVHWCIVGGESGPGARPMQLAWARDIRDQCAAAGTSFYMKQLGSHGRSDKGDDAADWPHDLRVQELPAAA